MTAFAAALVATMALGLWRVWRGPSRVDRLMAVQLCGTTGTAVLLVLAEGRPALLDVALVLGLLAATLSIALVQLLRREGRPDG